MSSERFDGLEEVELSRSVGQDVDGNVVVFVVVKFQEKKKEEPQEVDNEYV